MFKASRVPAPKNQLVTGETKKMNQNVKRPNRNGNREEITRSFVVEMMRVEMKDLEKYIALVEMTDDREIIDAMTDVVMIVVMIVVLMIVVVVIDVTTDVMTDEAAEIEMTETELVLGESRMIQVKLQEAVAKLPEAVARLREAVAKSHEAIALHNLVVVGAMLLHHARLKKSNVPKKYQLKQPKKHPKRHQVNFGINSINNHFNQYLCQFHALLSEQGDDGWTQVKHK